MSKNETSIYAFKTLVAPRVTRPKPAPTPATKLDAVRQLLAKGYTPAEAMAKLEKEDGHRAKLPETSPAGISNGVTRPPRKTGEHFEVLAQYFRTKIKNKWTVSKHISFALGLNKTHVQYDLAAMADRKMIERRKLSVHGPYEFREVQK